MISAEYQSGRASPRAIREMSAIMECMEPGRWYDTSELAELTGTPTHDLAPRLETLGSRGLVYRDANLRGWRPRYRLA